MVLYGFYSVYRFKHRAEKSDIQCHGHQGRHVLIPDQNSLSSFFSFPSSFVLFCDIVSFRSIWATLTSRASSAAPEKISSASPSGARATSKRRRGFSEGKIKEYTKKIQRWSQIHIFTAPLNHDSCFFPCGSSDAFLQKKCLVSKSGCCAKVFPPHLEFQDYNKVQKMSGK